jgi:hypothetical protein
VHHRGAYEAQPEEAAVVAGEPGGPFGISQREYLTLGGQAEHRPEFRGIHRDVQGEAGHAPADHGKRMRAR